MKKKMIAVLVLALVVSTASVFALGIGAQGGYSVYHGSSGALTIKPDGSKFIFSVNGNVNGWGMWAEGTADMWMANKTLAKPVNYFYGVGAAAGANIYDSISLTVAGRVFAGLNCFCLDNFLEFFLMAGWQPGIQINLGGNGDLILPLINEFPVNAGFRIWL